MKKVLFVCTGNTCRSVMAEWFFNEEVRGRRSPISEFWADSAGISAYEGDPPGNGVIKVLGDRLGLSRDDIGTRAKSLSQMLVDESFLILTMTRRQRDFVKERFPAARERTFTLKEYACEDAASDIEDPFGLSQYDYETCAEEIHIAVTALADILEGSLQSF